MTGDALVGYAVYIAFILVPGFGLGELLRAWREGDSLAERAGVAIALGLAIDTICVLIRTSGLTIGGFRLVGLEPATVYVVILLGVGALVISCLRTKRLPSLPRPSRSDLILSAAALVPILFFLVYFSKYPIFPQYFSVDFGNNANAVSLLTSGARPSIPSGLLYGAAHFQVGAALVLLGGDALIVEQRVAAILVVLSCFVIYAASVRILRNEKAALLVAVIYALPGFFWEDTVVGGGLFPNFVGMLLTLFVLVAFIQLCDGPRSWRTWAVGAISLLAGYFSHYTFLSVFPAFLVYALLPLARSRGADKRTVLPSLLLLGPAALALAADPGEVNKVLFLSLNTGGGPQVPTTLSSITQAVPVISFIFADIANDVGAVVMLLLACVAVYRAYRHKDDAVVIPLVWLAALMVAAPFGDAAWRFSLEGILPLTLLAGYGLWNIPPRDRPVRKIRARMGNPYPWFRNLAIAVVMVLLVVNSTSASTLIEATSGASHSVAIQQDVKTTIGWLGANTPPNSTYVTDYDFEFLYIHYNLSRPVLYEFIQNSSQARLFASENGPYFLLVVNNPTPLGQVPLSAQPWLQVQPSVNITLVYSLTNVKVYQVS